MNFLFLSSSRLEQLFIKKINEILEKENDCLRYYTG